MPRLALILAAAVALAAGGCRFDLGGLEAVPDGGPVGEAGVDVATGEGGPGDAAQDAPRDGTPDGQPDGPLPTDGQKDGAQSDAPPQTDAAQSDAPPQTDAAQSDAPSCGTGLTYCPGGGCVNLQTDPSYCGDCGTDCPSGNCSAGKCCPPGQTNCGGTCTNTNEDPGHCGDCVTVCTASQSCTGGDCVWKPGCADGSQEQTFTQGMVGCAGHVRFSDRATLCAGANGFRVCSAAEWNAGRGGTAPTHHYWTNDVLYARDEGGDGSGHCQVSATHVSGDWCDGTRPMRVCAPTQYHYDPENNHCNWINCGFETYTNQYFGGCNDDTYAGTLCCPQ